MDRFWSCLVDPGTPRTFKAVVLRNNSPNQPFIFQLILNMKSRLVHWNLSIWYIKKHFSFNGQCWLWNFKCVIKEILCELLTKQSEFLIMWAALLKKLTQGFLEKTPWFWQGVLITAHRILSGLHAFVFNKAECIIKWFLYYFFFWGQVTCTCMLHMKIEIFFSFFN